MKLTVRATGPLALEMRVRGRTERLTITSGDYPFNGAPAFQQVGALHMIASRLPQTVAANFPIHPATRQLINLMYVYTGKLGPFSRTPGLPCLDHTSRQPVRRVAVAFSPGKDSLWNTVRAIARYGAENVLAVHVGGINYWNASEERAWSRRQAELLGFNLRTVNVTSTARPGGPLLCRSRDLFLMGVIAPIAQEFGATRIITEGFAEAKPKEGFAAQERTMHWFNRVLHAYGLSVRVAWENRPEMAIIRDMYLKHPDWMPLVCNCVSFAYRKPGIRRAWKRHAPTFPLYDSQCGSCVKCRITNVARILYDPDVPRRARIRDIVEYLENTAAWTREYYPRYYLMLEGSYMRDLQSALRRYGLNTEVRPTAA